MRRIDTEFARFLCTMKRLGHHSTYGAGKGSWSTESRSSSNAISRDAKFVGPGSSYVEQRHPKALAGDSRGSGRPLASNSRSSPYSDHADGRSGSSHSGNPKHGWPHQYAHAASITLRSASSPNDVQ